MLGLCRGLATKAYAKKYRGRSPFVFTTGRFHGIVSRAYAEHARNVAGRNYYRYLDACPLRMS